MKKLLSVILVSIMAFSMVACGSTPATSESTSTDAMTEVTEEVEKEVAVSDFKVGMVTDTGGVNDGSFNQSSWEGLQRASDEFGITVNYLESSTDADYQTNIETFIDEEYDLIISVGFMLADATYSAAVEYPDQKFAILDDSTCADLPNVACLMFEQAEASYLVGYIAGLESESNNVGFLIGMSTPIMHEFGYGFVAGVLDANPDATVQQVNANSFGDPGQGKALTTSMITNGADVVFHAAGGTGLGLIEAAKESGIKAIGVDSDQSSLAPETIITSAMKRVDNASYDVAKHIVENAFQPGITVYDLETSGVDIAPTTDLLSAETLSAVEEIKAKIISGEIVVAKTKEDFEAAHGDVYILD